MGASLMPGADGKDPDVDVAVWRIGANHLPVAELGRGSLRVGQLVIAVGNPYGLNWTVTAGVSALGRTLDVPGTRKMVNLIQTDTSINPAIPVGRWWSSPGRVVGITTAMMPMAQGLGFSVPLDTMKSVIARISQKRAAATAGSISLGVGGVRIPLDTALQRNLHLAQQLGMQVLEIRPDGPADQAELKRLDVIVSADSEVVTEPRDLQRIVQRHQLGEKVVIGFIRDSKLRKVSAVL